MAASAGESKEYDPILKQDFNGTKGKDIIDELLKKPIFVEDGYVLSEYFNNIDVFDEAYDDFLSLYAYYVFKKDSTNEEEGQARRKSLEDKINLYLDLELDNVTIREEEPDFSNVTGRSKPRQEALTRKIERKKYWEKVLRRLSDIEKNSKKGTSKTTVGTVLRIMRLRI